MTDFYLSDPYLNNLENQLDVDPLTDLITVSNGIITSNVYASNADFIFSESYQLATTFAYTSNLLSSNVQTNLLTANNASLCNLTFSSALGSNMILTDLGAGIIDAYDIQTSILTCTSNATFSNLEASYVEAPTVVANMVYIQQLIDHANDVLINTSNQFCGTMSYSNLLDTPKPGGEDLMAYIQGLYDSLQTLYDIYDTLKSLIGNQPKIPDNLQDALNDSLGDSNDSSSNAINVHWNRVFAKPIATSNNDLGVKNNMYLSDQSKLFVIPSGNYSTNNGSLYNTTTTSNMLLDCTTQSMTLRALTLSNVQLSESNGKFGNILLQSNVLSTVSNIPLQLMSMTVSSNSISTNMASIADISVSNIHNQIISSNLSNVALPLQLTSTCNISLATGQSNYFQVNSSNFKVSESNLVFLQCTSNQNPFLTNSTTGLQLNTSNIILKNQNGSNSSTWVQDFCGLTLTMSYSNSSNQITSNLTIDSNLNMSNLNTLSIKSNLNTPALIATNSNVFVNSNLSTGKDVVCGGVVRSSVMQIGTGIQATGGMTSGLYGDNARLILDSSGTFYPNDTINWNDLTSGTVSMQSVPSTAGWKGNFSKSIFNY